MTKKNIGVLLVSLALMLSFCKFSFGDDIKGYMIPEYYMVGSHHDGEDGGYEGQHGFWLRRIYFGYNANLGDGWSARVRLEMNSDAFGSDKITPYIKNAHVKKSLGGGASLMVGIIDPPSFNKIEDFWGFRYIEKTAPDFFKLASSRDFGIALDGKSKSGLVYTVMYGNYSSNKGEDNKGKAVYGRLGFEKESLYLEANGHYASDDDVDIVYLSFFGGLKGTWGRFGVGYHYRDDSPEEGDSENNGIISAFAVINFSKKASAFARYDHLTDYNFKNPGDYLPIPASTYKARMLMAGVNFNVNKFIQISPNVKYVFYGDPAVGEKPDGDFYFNLTAKIGFKSSIGK